MNFRLKPAVVDILPPATYTLESCQRTIVFFVTLLRIFDLSSEDAVLVIYARAWKKNTRQHTEDITNKFNILICFFDNVVKMTSTEADTSLKPPWLLPKLTSAS